MIGTVIHKEIERVSHFSANTADHSEILRLFRLEMKRTLFGKMFCDGLQYIEYNVFVLSVESLR